MREFRIKVNNEKAYVVKANDYNQAVKTLHSKLRDFDDTKKNINVVREFITNNGGKFSKSKDADAILDFIYKKTGVKNADYGDVLYIIRNYTNVKVEDNAVSDSISRYTGEDAIRTNGFVKIKEDGDLTSYRYNGSDFDGAVFKIHQYNPSLIAFVSNGNRTITVRNKYLNDADNTAQGEIEVLKSFGFDYKDGKWVKESNNNDIIVQPDYHYVSVIGPGDTEKHCKKYQYQSAGMLKKIIASNIKDSSITDADMKIAEDIIKKYGGNPVGNVMGLQKTRFVGQDEIKNQHDFATELDKAGYKFYLINGRYRISPKDSSIDDNSPKYSKGQKIQTSAGVHEIIGYDPVRADANTNRIEYSYRLKTPNGTYTNIPDWQLEKLVELGRYKLIDSSIKDVDWDFANKLKQHSQEEIRNALKYSAPTVYKQYRNGETIQFAGLAGQLTGPEKTKVLKRLGDSNILSGYKYRIINNGTKWYYETTFPDGHTTLTGPYSSKQETEQYFHKHRPTEKLTDADPVKVEKIIRKEKSALGVTYYIFQTKSSSGYTIYYQVTDKTYHGEPTYSGGGIISLSLKSANDTLDHNLLADKLKAKYGEKEGTKRYLRGENDSAIKDKLSTSDANSLVEAYIDKYKYTHSNLPYVNKPEIKIFNSPEEFRDRFLSSHRGYSIYAGGLLNYNGYVVKLFTSAKDGKIESPSADNIFTIFPTTAIKDSNIKDAGFDAEYAEHQRKLDAEVRRAKELHKVNSALDYTTLFKQVFNYKSRGDRLTQLTKTVGDYTYVIYLNNNRILYCVWDKSGNIPKGWCPTVTMYDEYTIKDSNNIKNRKSYTIKVGDKQYKVFAESESEAINKYIKSKKQ